MENIKLIVDGNSVGSVSVDDEGTVTDVFIHKTAPEGTEEKVSSNGVLGSVSVSSDYYTVE